MMRRDRPRTDGTDDGAPVACGEAPRAYQKPAITMPGASLQDSGTMVVSHATKSEAWASNASHGGLMNTASASVSNTLYPKKMASAAHSSRSFMISMNALLPCICCPTLIGGSAGSK
eukprot:scaffold211649_cov34-Tisochrysis_lutea.AAC.4